MTARHRFSLVAAMLVLVAWVLPVQAWLRMPYEDAEVVARSELIVVGHFDKSSIKYVQHENSGGGGASWEYHVTLVVTEVLKGELKDKQIPIVINYGLDPLVGGRIVRENKSLGVGEPDPAIPQDRIDLMDSGDHGGTVLQDAQKDNLWFLRPLGGELGRDAGKGPLGIVDPEDVAALKFKDYYKALLSKDADEQMNALLANPDESVIARALRHLSAEHRPEDAARIAQLLSGPSEKVHGLAAEALLEVADLSAVPTFRAALGHANAEVRAAACVGLCRFHDTSSIRAIAKMLPDLPPQERVRVIALLPRMQSREVVGPLLDQLDEHRDLKGQAWPNSYAVSTAAAKALRTLTGVEFPLDTAEARRQWDALRVFSDEVLLRKSMREDIEDLTSEGNYPLRWDAYESLGRLANQHYGSYSSEQVAARKQSQELWREWAKANLTKTRGDWIYAGFAQSGIVLPRPMDAKGIDTLIAVLEFYGDRAGHGPKAPGPGWSTEGGWVMARFHQENATWLLEQVTGYEMGLSFYEWDLRVGRQNVNTTRWAAWWKEHRDQAKILPLPEEKPVPAEELARVPSMRPPPAPLSLTISPKSPVHIFKGKEPLTLVVEIKNVAQHEVVIEQRPYEVGYSWGNGRGSSGSGSCGGASRGGLKNEDYVTLQAGQSITWEQTGAPDVDNYTEVPTVENLQYTLTFPDAGSQLGLHAWRGKLYSNMVNCKIQEKKSDYNVPLKPPAR